MLSPMPTIKLANGVTIGNFSSPHPFTFDTGEILPACEEDRARALTLEVVEEEVCRPLWTDVSIKFSLSDAVKAEFLRIHREVSLDDWDNYATIILVPLPVLESVKAEDYWGPPGIRERLRVVRMKDRVNKIIWHNRFCV